MSASDADLFDRLGRLTRKKTDSAPFGRDELMAYALKTLNLSMQSERDLRRKLEMRLRKERAKASRSRGGDGEDWGQEPGFDLTGDEAGWIDSIIADLRAWRYLDDRVYAEEYIRRNQAAQGRLRLIAGLRSKGVDASLAKGALEGGDERRRAAALLARKFPNRAGATGKERSKMLRFLQGRGFGPDDCVKATEYYLSEQWVIDRENDGEDF